MSIQPRDLGVVVGRFNHEQLGHVSLFDTSRIFCQRTLVLVGSANEYGTLRNPFRVETRKEVIQNTYPNESDEVFMVRGLNDLTNELDISNEWGEYVISEVKTHMHKFASLMIYGNDEFRSQWFDAQQLKDTMEIIVPRSTIAISGTEIRGLLLLDMEEEWQKYTHPLIHRMYQRLRSELLQVEVYKEIYNTVRKTDMTMEDFMRVYAEYERIDKETKMAAIGK